MVRGDNGSEPLNNDTRSNGPSGADSDSRAASSADSGAASAASAASVGKQAPPRPRADEMRETVLSANRIAEEAWIVELARAKAICTVCGGVCQPKIENAILLSAAEEAGGPQIPRCSCEDCSLCKWLKEGLDALVEEEEA